MSITTTMRHREQAIDMGGQKESDIPVQNRGYMGIRTQTREVERISGQ